MPPDQPTTLNAGEVTLLLDRWKSGDPIAVETLVPKLYRKLRQLAESRMAHEPVNHTLQPTALVHEAWLQLEGRPAGFRNRGHFFAAAALAMRGILIDHARRLRAEKYGGGHRRIAFEQAFDQVAVPGDAGHGDRVLDALALGEALDRLNDIAPVPCTVATMRFLFGSSVADTAEALGVSSAKVKKDWAFARAWLNRFLRQGEHADG